MNNNTLFQNYCKALNLKEADPILQTEYYKKGFEEYKKLKKDYDYYCYMEGNL